MSSARRKPNFRRLEEVDKEIGPQPEDTATVLVGQLEPRKSQPRLVISEESIEELTGSILQHGMLNPITVRFIGNATYEIIAGERRYRAALKAGLERVPVTVRNVSDEEAEVYGLVENLQRENLNAYEETMGTLVLLSHYLNMSVAETKAILNALIRGSKGKSENADSQQLTQYQAIIEDTFRKLGSRSWKTFVTYKMRVLNLPEDMLTLLSERKIAYSTALELSKVKDEAQRCSLSEAIINEKLTREDVKARIRELMSGNGISPTVELSRRAAKFSNRLKKMNFSILDNRHDRIRELLEELERLLEDEV